MCGIVGYIGKKDAREIIMNGLKKLEYRGYDSAGVALLNNNTNNVEVFKEKGRLVELEKILDNSFETNFGIGHTRWATHGVPNRINSHPHFSQSRRFIIVHNGVIENVHRLSIEKLAGDKFLSDTDTEVIAHLIELNAKTMTTEEAIRKTMSELEGSFALLIIDTLNLDNIYVVKNKTPLLIGYDESGFTLASDVMPLIGLAKKYVILEDQSFAVISKDNYQVYDIIGKKIYPTELELNLTEELISKGSYDHYMLKEIDEQPGVLRNIMVNYFIDDRINVSKKIQECLLNSNRIYIIAAGTSMHAGLVGKELFEKISKIPCEVHIASEFAYNAPLIVDSPYFIFISQSGETADCITALKKIKKEKYRTLTITNVPTSTLAREADDYLPILAGPEISVASTKAYTGQIALLSILSFSVSNKKNDLKHELTKVVLAIEDVFNNKKELIKNVVKNRLLNTRNCFYIGRGIDYYVSLEAALKLKEITYIQTEGFASGELKHGTIALIEEGTPVIAIITQYNTNLNTRSNLKEVQSRGATCTVISREELAQPKDDIVTLDVMGILTPLVTASVIQLIAYYTAIMKGKDVDKPRNLAKSVTVE